MTDEQSLYSYFTAQAKEIENKHNDLEKLKEVHKKIDKQEEETFRPFTPEEIKKLTWLGVLCVAALVFDFLVNSRTMGWMPDNLYPVPVAIYALVFTFFDAIIASMQAGVFVTIQLAKYASKETNEKVSIGDVIESNNSFKKAKNTWRPVLWGLAAIKIVLFLSTLEASSVSSNLVVFIMLAFIIIIYAILDMAGAGIYIIFNKVKFYILRDIWHINPETFENSINKLYDNVEKDETFIKAKLTINGFIKFFNLPGKIFKKNRG